MFPGVFTVTSVKCANVGVPLFHGRAPSYYSSSPSVGTSLANAAAADTIEWMDWW